jgi:type IV pilus assembly protein PilQ
MRLKQLLGYFTLLLVLSTTLAASASQLTDVAVQSKGNTTTLTIRASGSFTHTEYRPTDNLLLVDLAGVSAAKLENRSRELREHPGVDSFRVLGYKSANGADTARVELTLAADAQVNVAEGPNSLSVRVTSESAKATTSAMPVSLKTAEVTSPVTKATVVRAVSVSTGKDGLNIKIAASAPIAPQAMKLSSPDRIVIDVPNAIPARKVRQIAVHTADVKSIRVSHYSVNPPATRIVVDLEKPQEFEMAANGTNTLLTLRAAAMPQVAMATSTSADGPQIADVAPSVAVVPAAASAPQPSVPTPTAVVLEPTVTTRPATANDVAPITNEVTPAQRAAEAAAKFNAPAHDVPLTNVNATMKPQPAMNLAMLQQAAAPAPVTASAASSGGCTGSRFTGEPISVNLKDVDLRDFFRLIHEISGLNVVLDPKVAGTLTIVLDDVPWDQALSIVMKNNGLDCQLDGNVLRIATIATMKKEADDRRAQLEAQALAVEAVTIQRYLSYAVAKDAVPTVKTFLSARGSIIADERTNSLIISDIPSVMPAVDRLIRELDRKTQEVEIEARVVAATRNFARDIGTQFAFMWNNASTGVGGAQAGRAPGIVPGVVPFFSTLGVGANATSGIGISNRGANYSLDFVLTAFENRGLIKILSRPRIITQNNIQAVVRQGQRIPVVTGAQLGGPPTVTYVDAFLRLTVRPQITAENTIFLNVDVENTVPDFTRVTNVQLNPILITQQATTQVLVTDGGTVVIGGVIQTQTNVGINQVPVLGNIPVFGNLFKRRSLSTTTQELIFFLTPKIIQT